jgi:molybdopterin-guanine dinucleotide biosynthesis adapter protein
VSRVKALQIVGRKKVGKTTFVTRLIPLLRERGLRVASVKHTRNPYPLDRPGTDSQRHREAGAEATLVLTATHGALHFAAPEDPKAGELLMARLLGEFDLVIIEGWRERRGPRIEILAVDAEGHPDPIEHPDPEELLAMVLGPQAPADWAQSTSLAASLASSPAQGARPAVPVFAWDDVEGVRDLVERWAAGG